jgi:hypothetical protein
MKVQFASGTIRLRVTHAEFHALSTGAALSLGIAMPGGRWQVDVAPARDFAVNLEAMRLAISLPACDLAGLADRLPTREGLRWQVDTPDGPISVAFEVDIRDRPARRVD